MQIKFSSINKIVIFAGG